MPFCLVNTHQIYYTLHGREMVDRGKPLLVFLHEGLGSLAQWKDFPADLAGRLGLPWLVYDRYGHGMSDQLRELREPDYLWKEAKEELPVLLEHLHLYSPLLLIGHSDGATIALMYASLFPERVGLVISEAAHVFLEDISRQGIREAMKRYQEERLKEFLERYHGEKTDTMFRGWAGTWTSPGMDGWSMEEDMARISSPVLGIQGVMDEYGSPHQLERIAKHCGGPVETWLLPDCAHIPHFQQRQLVTE